MNLKINIFQTIFLIAFASCSSVKYATIFEQEKKYISNIRQLTFEGENAEGYFSFDEKKFVFQRHVPTNGEQCDQIYIYNLENGYTKRVSSGKGKTTCSYFLPGDSLILYATTDFENHACPTAPDMSQGYTWALNHDFDIVVADTNGKIVRQLTNTPGYDAEATISPTGDKIIFTSLRNGDIDLYSMDLFGGNVRQITNKIGYDGGAFYSFDGKKIVFRRSNPEGKDLETYKNLLKQNLVKPSKMEICVANEDGSGFQQITNNGKANFAPFWHPDGEHIIFVSNMNDPKGRNFDLFLIKADGTELTQITFNANFDGFPMFSRDGKKLIFASNRDSKQQGETNLFICDFKL